MASLNRNQISYMEAQQGGFVVSNASVGKKKYELVSKTINRGDWSGKEVTFRHSNNLIKMENIELKLVRGKDWIKTSFRYYGDKEWTEFVKLFKFDDEWITDDKHGVQREGKDEYSVIVQAASMLI